VPESARLVFGPRVSDRTAHTRSWAWLPSVDPGWPGHYWVTEEYDDDDARWYARISDSGNRTVRPVVLIHGLIVSGSYFRPVASYLDDHMRLYVPDLPGFGKSVSHTGIWTLEHLTEGLAGWLDLHGLRDAMLISNSLGCQVLTMLAVQRPDLVHTLVLVAPTMDPAATSIPRLMVRGLIDIPRETSSLWKVWLPDFVRAGPRRGLLTLHNAIVDRQEERLSRVTAKVILVGGERDPIVPPDWVRAMAGMFPNGRVLIIPKAPHAMNYSNPRELARIIRVAVMSADDDARSGGVMMES